MTTFVDGPAKGQHFMLRRAPFFLRVTECAGKWDALDQVEDKPEPNEQFFAYRLAGQPGGSFVRMAKGGGGFYPLASYKLIEPQPTPEQMRDNEAWTKWTESQMAFAEAEIKKWKTS